MTDFFEIDFLAVEAKKSGDAIALRYVLNGIQYVHIVDCGYEATGPTMLEHIRKYYGPAEYVDHVVLTHNDRDHACGLPKILESLSVGTLWMLRPWLYANELLPRFSRFTSVENLKTRLKEIYPNIAELERIAAARGILIKEPFQGAEIGAFRVLAPSKRRYLDLIVQSDRTPEAVEEARSALSANTFDGIIQRAIGFMKSLWGQEVFSPEGTSAENEMSIVQYANLNGQRILLTGDAGRDTLTEAADFAPIVGIALPGIDRFQVPHHGARRNVSTEVLDRILGPRLASPPAEGQGSFTAIVSSAKEDKLHPRKAVTRAMKHRGGRVYATEGVSIRTSLNSPARDGWNSAVEVPYSEDQEE